ncbi:MAG: hypothetical protein H6686_05265 [Fibrobacteria bacterium]|nr:hypothetical protein [Fibrobacteria bacterium]
MKFTRVLTLALAAAAAMSMTACDEATSSTPSSDNGGSGLSCSGPVSSGVITIHQGSNAWAVGTQSAPSGSFASIQWGKTWNSAGLRANNYAAWDSVDLIVFADSTDNTHASFYSPARAKVVFKGSPVASNPSPAATLFKLVAADRTDYDFPATLSELTDALKSVRFSATSDDQVSVRHGQVYAARLSSGKCALLDVQTANEAGAFNISLGLDVYR